MSHRLIPIDRLAVSRRSFFQQGAMLLGGALFAERSAAAHATPGAPQGCRPTEPDILGPFYRFGAPFQSKLAGPAEPGERLIVSGTVYSSDCRTPLPGALIEVWQANQAGAYDTTQPGNFTEQTAFRLRGLLQTDKRGRYEIETVMPGRYPIPPDLPGLERYAGVTRPAHIHFRVMESLHIPLTTQLYFRGDPFIGGDPWAKHKPSLAIGLKQEGQYLRGVFDLVLANGF